MATDSDKTCAKCNRQFISRKALNAHLKIHREGYEPRSAPLMKMLAGIYSDGLRYGGATDAEAKIAENAFIAGYEARKPKPRK